MANKATPSTKAAMIIIFIRISPETSGWRAIASIAEPPILPIPKPAPITAKPAPSAAPTLLKPTPAAACHNTVDSNITFLFFNDLFYAFSFSVSSTRDSPINTADSMVNTYA